MSENTEEFFGEYSFGDLLKTLRKQASLGQQTLAEQLGIHRNTIGMWERGETLPDNRTMVLELARRLHLDKQQTRLLLEASLTTLLPRWHVPSPRNPFFTGREAVLASLHQILRQARAATLTQSFTLSGLGGIGKTTTALEYAYRHTYEYTSVFWINASTSDSLLADVSAIAYLLNLPEKQEHEQSRLAAALVRWLNSHRDWLLIFDNVEEIELIKGLLPAARQGALLLTTRKQALGMTAHTLDLEPLTTEESIHFLLHRARLLDPMATRDTLAPADEAAVHAIVSAMDGLPLALDQAGAYIEAIQCSLPDYLHLLQSAPLRLLNERGAHLEHSISVAKTFTLAFAQLTRANAAAAELLTACAFLAPETIPEEFFSAGAAPLGPTFETLASDPFQFNTAIQMLLAYSLVQRQATTRTLTIHRLVQMVLKASLPETLQRAWNARLIHAMNQIFPSHRMQADYWQVCKRLFPHALALVRFALDDPGEEDATEMITLAIFVANYCWNCAQFAEAKELYQRALHTCEQTLGPEHLLVAKAVQGLAIVCFEQGKYEEAEPLYQRALSIREQALGAEHPLTANPLSNLALLYAGQGKYREAEQCYQRTLRIHEQTLGPEHPEVARSLNNLAGMYLEQARYAQAELLLQRALCISEKALGGSDPEVAFPLSNLVLLYTRQGKYEEADSLSQRALDIWEQALGPEHPDVAYALSGWAEAYREQGKHKEAEPLYQRALHLWEQGLGAGHHLLARPLVGLGLLYTEQQHYAEAESVLRRALDIVEHALGAAHPEITRSLNALGYLYLEQDRSTEAEPFLQRALKIREQAQLVEHPDTAETLVGLAKIYSAQSNYTEALALYQQALAIREQTLGAQHPKMRATQAAYAELLAEVADGREAGMEA